MKYSLLMLVAFMGLQTGIASAQSLTENRLYAVSTNAFLKPANKDEISLEPVPHHHHYRKYHSRMRLNYLVTFKNKITAGVGIIAVDEFVGGYLGLAYDRFLTQNRLISVHLPFYYGAFISNVGVYDARSGGSLSYTAPGLRFHSQLVSRRKADVVAGPSFILGSGHYYKKYEPYAPAPNLYNIDTNFTITGFTWDSELNLTYGGGKGSFIFGIHTTEGAIFNWHGKTVFLFQIGVHIGGGF